MSPVRIGVLGAARIAPRAIIEPARDIADTEVVGVAARDGERGRAFAAAHGIPTAYDSYEAMIGDDGVDAVYNALPNGWHGRWTIAALAAGKHVLCEKPFTANAVEAELVAAAASRSNAKVMEAMHYRYHPLMARAVEILRSGSLGAIRHLEARMIVVLPNRADIRYRLDLAGGAVMDVGCYSIHQLRTLAGAEPVVTSARARLRGKGVDRWMRAEFAFPDRATGRMTCALLSAQLPLVDFRVECDEGSLMVRFPNRPHMSKGILVRLRDGSRSRERVPGRPTFSYQLQAFCDLVLRNEPVATGLPDAIANMRAIDAVYKAAGLPRREPAA